MGYCGLHLIEAFVPQAIPAGTLSLTFAKRADEVVEPRHLLFFEQYWPGKQVGMTLAGPSYSRFRSRAPTNLAFFTAQEAVKRMVDQQPHGGSVVFTTSGLWILSQPFSPGISLQGLSSN